MPDVEPSTPVLGRDEGPLFRAALVLFVGSIAFSVAGLLFLKLVPSAIGIFGPYYATLVKAPTWTFMVLLAILPLLMYGPTIGWSRIGLFFFWGCMVGGAAELIGTTELLTVGSVPLPFGEYHYTNWLGPKIAGHVPYFIPPSWFAMSVISLDLARRTASRPWSAILLGTLYMVLWDVSLDPAMNHAFPFWNYATDGLFFGMPLSNWGGWAAVTLVILVGYEYATAGRRVHHAWAPWIYVLNCFFPISITLVQGVPLAALIGAVTAAIPFLVIWTWNPSSLARSLELLHP